MNIFLLLTLVFFVPLALFIAYLVLSSCLGDRLRARIAGTGIDIRHGIYDKNYARNIGSGLHAGGWEQIEMESIMEHQPQHVEDF